VGQLLYLEAEAIGIRSTGIGCFFDDSTHRLAEMKAMATPTATPSRSSAISPFLAHHLASGPMACTAT
jgi:hypothetical protein